MVSLIVVFFFISFSCEQAQSEEHVIYWNASNPDFRYPEGPSNSVDVNMDDTIRIICPGMNDRKRYLKIYEVTDLSFNDCLLETQKTLVLTCDGRNTSEKQTIVHIRRFNQLQYSSAIDFEPGKTYYWITTSTGAEGGINQTQRGMCAADNMRLMIRVRAFQEAADHITGRTTSRTTSRNVALREHHSQVNSRLSATAHSYSSYPYQKELEILDGFSFEQVQKVASLAQHGATGTFLFDQPVETSRGIVNTNSKAESIFWDAAPLLQDVLTSASDNIVLGSSHSDEEGTFVVHEDIGRSYEYQSDAMGTMSLTCILCTAFFVLVCNGAFY